MDDLESEMGNRFSHQDKLLGNMSQFVTRFQQTLKIFGKDVWQITNKQSSKEVLSNMQLYLFSKVGLH